MRKFIQWGILSVLMTVGFLAFLVLAGEDNPYDPMPFFQVFHSETISVSRLGRLRMDWQGLRQQGLAA